MNGRNSVIKTRDVLACMAARIDFQPGKALLSSLGLPTSVGWEKTIVAAESALSTHKSPLVLKAKLQEIFVTHTKIGEKSISYFGFGGLSRAIKKGLQDEVALALSKQSIPDSKFKSVYPLAIHDQKLLKKLEGFPPILTAIESDAGKVAFHFCSVRAFHERFLIDTDKLDSGGREYLSEYSEVYGMKAIRRQCFDSVVFDPARELVELRSDSPDGMSVMQKKNGVRALKEAFNSLSIFSSRWSPFDGIAYNFHDLLKNLYATGREGDVFQLGFTASTKDASSNNGAKLLRRKGVDLRKDPFHQGGKKEVKDLSPYTIGVEWKTVQLWSNPKLIVPGSVKMLYKPPILFPEILVRDCYTQQQFDFISSKIEKYR